MAEPPVCGQGGCLAVRVPDAQRCWEHLPAPDGLAVALSKLKPGANIDLRGTRLDGTLLGQILAPLRDGDGKPTIGQMNCDYARFTTFAKFDRASFSEEATFIGCTFDAGASAFHPGRDGLVTV